MSCGCVPSEQIEGCIYEIRQWMANNMLALNDGKTEVIKFSSKFGNGDGPRECDIQVGSAIVHSSSIVRDLGVTLDASMTMTSHIASICKSASFALWKIGKIRNLLDQQSTEKLVHAFVTSRLDYCNSLLYGLPDYQIHKLQSIQNAAARLVMKTPRTDHITPVLHNLHWLPIQKRIKFKILCLTYKVLSNMSPVYLRELLEIRSSGRTLRSSTEGAHTLRQPIANTVFYGDRAFSVCAPRLWNRLPVSLRLSVNIDVFKSNLKTHLFIE